MYKKNFLSRRPTKRTKTMKRGTSRLRRDSAPEKEMMGPRKMKKAGGKAFDMLKVKPTVKGKKLKPVPMDKKKSLGKLPTEVRNKMGFMKDGGRVKKANGGTAQIKGFGKARH